MGRAERSEQADDAPGLRRSIAVCLVGEPRTFVLPCVHQSLRPRLLSPLAQHHGDVTLFAVLRGPTNFSSDPTAASIEAVKAALAVVQPDVTRWIGPDEASRPCAHRCSQSASGVLGSGPKGYVHSCALGSVHACASAVVEQQLGWERCLAAVEEYEAGRAARFDAVLKTRPDMLWFDEAPGLDYAAAAHLQLQKGAPGTSVGGSGGSDWTFAVPRSLAGAALGWLRDFCEACRRPDSWMSVPLRIEDLLVQRLERGRAGQAARDPKAGAPAPRVVGLPAIIVRSASQPIQRQMKLCRFPQYMGDKRSCAVAVRSACWRNVTSPPAGPGHPGPFRWDALVEWRDAYRGELTTQ